jgi:hypothetical protein
MARINIDFGKKLGCVKPMHAVNNGPVYKFAVDQRITNIDDYRAAGIPFARNHDAAFYSTYGGEHTVDVHNIFTNFDADPYLPESYDFAMTDEYIKVCEFADNNLWAKFLLGFVYAFPSCYFYTLAVCQQTKYERWQLIIVVSTVILSTFVKLFNANLGLIVDLWQLLFMPFIFILKDKKRLLNIPLGFALILTFQVISMFTKNVELKIMGDNMLVGAIFSIDVILMVLLYYAYSNLISKKGGK